MCHNCGSKQRGVLSPPGPRAPQAPGVRMAPGAFRCPEKSRPEPAGWPGTPGVERLRRDRTMTRQDAERQTSILARSPNTAIRETVIRHRTRQTSSSLMGGW